jgi:Trp operon repressor
VSKVLHRKRPDLVPLYDSRIFQAYTAPGAVPRATDRSWQNFMALLCMQMREDLRTQSDAFDELVRLAEEQEAPVTRLRILDILVWRTAESWH